MPKGILVVQTRPVSAEREDEYNKWYSEEHVPDILAIPGFVGARRYRVHDTADVTADPATPEYITIYEIEADDLATPLQALRTSSNEGRVRRSSSLQTDPPPLRTFYELID